MMGAGVEVSVCPEFVEVDPSGRYGRYDEILGKGASKTVYRGFDEYEGIEVAWNQVKLYDFLQSPENLERLYCEIHLLKTLKHKNIMKFYTSWVDTTERNINFVTELFTSGTLRQYRQKHRRVNIRAVKHWCRQILSGLLYLHSHDPPIIHRDLKCDNIFINGNQGEVKIGDLGLAAILRKSHAIHCVGTPEFMAPEVYEEEYNELVDIYSFGMCVLEMVTFEYPYSECSHPVQIYKKVISGTKPEALYRVKDLQVRQFIEKCLTTVSQRLSARELLEDPFLQLDDLGSAYYVERDISCADHILREPHLEHIQCNGSFAANELSNSLQHQMELENGWEYDTASMEVREMNFFNGHKDEHYANVDITIKGKKREDGNIFLRLRISDKDGCVRNIYFLFDIEADTALSVATEMVAELDIIDYDVTRIADMIDEAVASLVPEWKPGPGIEEHPGILSNVCGNCTSNFSSCGSLINYPSLKNPCHTNMNSVHCCHFECAETHGRFEEITYQVEETELCVTDGAPMLSTSQSDGLDVSSLASRFNHSDEECEQLDVSAKGETIVHMDDCATSDSIKSLDQMSSLSQQQLCHDPPKFNAQLPARFELPAYVNEIGKDLRLLEASHQTMPRGQSHQHLGGAKTLLQHSPDSSNCKSSTRSGFSQASDEGKMMMMMMKSFHLGKRNSFHIRQSETIESCILKMALADSNSMSCCLQSQMDNNFEVSSADNPELMFTANTFYSGAASALTRTKSLAAVDVVDA